uniref:hypothetical protein n=1 Tax=Flavobacterium sp. TaxID=239 RepID=UPI004049B743
MEFTAIIKDSEKRLSKLKVLTNFFNQSQIVAISVRTKVIHDLFALNKSLDINKLELFHLQFTDSLLDLLVKLKKNVEQKYLQINNEIQINTDIINSYTNKIKKDVFADRVKTHNLIMQTFMESLYHDLAFDNKVSVLTNLKVKNDLSNEMGHEYYRKLSVQAFEQLNAITSSSVYLFLDFKIDKKLLGRLNIQKFQFKFKCGFQFNNQFIEVYEFIHCNEYFIFLKDKNEFLDIEISDFKDIDFSKNISNCREIILKLKRKNVELTNQAERAIKTIPNDIALVLIDYYDKISSMEFMGDLQNIDEQTNVLRTMLNININ